MDLRRRDRRFPGTIALFLVLIAVIVGSNAAATARQRDAALIVNVAGRQRALAERYIKDVLLEANGYAADPDEDATMLLQNADALLNGGAVLAVQGADATVRIRPIRGDAKTTAKLVQERALIRKLLDTGRALLTQDARTDPDFGRRVQELRIIGAQVSSVTADAVGEMTRHAQASLGRLVWVGVGLGLVGAAAAIAMGLSLRRNGAQQAAQFRSLVQNASDLVTVLDAKGGIRYQSASSDQVLGIESSQSLGRSLFEMIHPDDVQRVRRVVTDLQRHPSSVSRLEYRVREGRGAWRHVESAITNSIADPSVQGLVLNTRDMSERHEADEKLRKLQAERSGLLEQTVQATELERKRVAAELHDGPVQHLTALDLKLESLRHRLAKADAIGTGQLLDRLQEQLRGEVKDLRKMMSGLRPPMLDERGLPAALLEHLGGVERENELDCDFQSDLQGRLDPAHEVILYRVAQEALTNVVKHARARRARVSLLECDGHVVLEVRDDGVGFDPSATSTTSLNGHFGLVGMRERVEMAGGTWLATASPGRGTVIRAELPREAKVS